MKQKKQTVEGAGRFSPGAATSRRDVAESDRLDRAHAIAELALILDERQYEVGFGPCVDAALTFRTVTVSADSDDSPYRDFAHWAARARVQYSVAVGMPITERIACAMNVYCRAEPAEPSEFTEYAEIFSAYATVVIHNLVRYSEATDRSANL